MRSIPLFITAAAILSACSATPSPESVARASTPPPSVVRETVTVRDADLERRVSRLELRLLEKEAQVVELETRLGDTRDEVVRTMARIQTAASRAQAASGIAEADVALQTLRSSPGAAQLTEVAQVAQLVRQSSAEFNKNNFGGALYLSTQAKVIANAARGRLSGGDQQTARPGETMFALPVRVKASSRGNVRDGPGTGFPVAFAVNQGTLLTAFSYTDEWVRVSDDAGRGGWIFNGLVTRP
ncbi:MAG: SH3 domain-containing protein [Gemmatimonadaceae bacterium]